VPDSEFRSIKQGWIDYYWKPFKKDVREVATAKLSD